MAALFGGVSFIVTLLALELLKTTSASDPHPAPMVHCWCVAYPNVTFCSWPEPRHFPPARYVATYSERHNQTATKECDLVPPGNTSPALMPSGPQQVWLCHLPNLKLLTDYIINVTAVYSGGSSFSLSSFMLEDIVKPDPPVDVRVSPQNIRNLLVQWSPPPTWDNLDIFPLKYQIQYQWENRGMTKTVNLGPFESTKVELKGLTSGRTYRFQVCAKELLGLGHCSSWTSHINITIAWKKT